MPNEQFQGLITQRNVIQGKRTGERLENYAYWDLDGIG